MLTTDQIEGIIYRIQELRKKWMTTTAIEEYVKYLNANDIKVEFTEEGVTWKRTPSIDYEIGRKEDEWEEK